MLTHKTENAYALKRLFGPVTVKNKKTSKYHSYVQRFDTV